MSTKRGRDDVAPKLGANSYREGARLDTISLIMGRRDHRASLGDGPVDGAVCSRPPLGCLPGPGRDAGELRTHSGTADPAAGNPELRVRNSRTPTCRERFGSAVAGRESRD